MRQNKPYLPKLVFIHAFVIAAEMKLRHFKNVLYLQLSTLFLLDHIFQLLFLQNLENYFK